MSAKICCTDVYRSKQRKTNYSIKEHHMLSKISKFFKKIELASDALVLEKIPNSAQAQKIRSKSSGTKSTAQPSTKLDPDFAMRLASESAKACHAIQELARIGDPEGMFHLADMYQSGFGVEIDIDEALRLFKLSAQAGFVPAQVRLGNAFFEGSPFGQSYSEAFFWYKLGADSGDDVCQKNMGLMYLHGIEVERDIEEALKWLQASSKQGNYVAQRNIADMYLTGNGVLMSKPNALKWLTIAKTFGDPKADYEISKIVKDVKTTDLVKTFMAADEYCKSVQ